MNIVVYLHITTEYLPTCRYVHLVRHLQAFTDGRRNLTVRYLKAKSRRQQTQLGNAIATPPLPSALSVGLYPLQLACLS